MVRVLVVIAAVLCVSAAVPHRVRRGFGGRLTDINNVPWTAQIQGRITDFEHNTIILSDNSICGAIILNERQVLTAAHCVDDSISAQEGDFRVYAGTDYRTKSLLWARPSKLYDMGRASKRSLHPLYKAGDLEHDLAIITLVEPLDMTLGSEYWGPRINPLEYASPADLPTADTADVRTVVFGTDYEGKSGDDLAREVNLKRIANEQCGAKAVGTVQCYEVLGDGEISDFDNGAAVWLPGDKQGTGKLIGVLVEATKIDGKKVALVANATDETTRKWLDDNKVRNRSKLEKGLRKLIG